MPDHEERSSTPEESTATTDADAELTDEADPTFADGTAREIEDASQPLSRDEEGLDR